MSVNTLAIVHLAAESRPMRRRAAVPNARFEVQDDYALSYPDGFFSTIVSSNTLEHVADDQAMLRASIPATQTS
jgi:hypothetical protein